MTIHQFRRRRIADLVLLLKPYVTRVIVRMGHYIAPWIHSDLHSAVDEVFSVGFPQADVPEQLSRLIRSIVNVPDELESV